MNDAQTCHARMRLGDGMGHRRMLDIGGDDVRASRGKASNAEIARFGPARRQDDIGARCTDGHRDMLTGPFEDRP